MARNVIESINTIFKLLENKISDEDKIRIIRAKRRLINPSDPAHMASNINVIGKSSVKSRVLLNYNTNIYGLTYENRIFVLIPAKSQLNNEFSPGFLSKVSDENELGDGFKLFVISEELVPLNFEIDLSESK